MKVQFFTTPQGEGMAILARADYEALLNRASDSEEDEADSALYDARKAGHSSALPKEITERILRGMSLLKAVRDWRDMTQMQVAEFHMNIGQGYLSDLESGKRKGTPETLAKLSEIYKVPKEWFL
eukprot:gene9463-9543_t